MAKNIKVLKAGTTVLKLFIALLLADVLLAIGLVFRRPESYVPLIVFLAGLAVFEFVLFWMGIILVYASSIQLGIKQRILGIAMGWIPIANIIMLLKIVSICSREIKTETGKYRLNESRKAGQICRTRYPILLVHGVFFRDSKVLNYWGRIPGELKKNGAVLFYGNHNSAASVMDSSRELERRILEIVRETGCEKVNVIAHSKGGLDTRSAIAHTSAGKHIASLTTINTPHRGCEFADYFLNKIPEGVQLTVAAKYNAVASKLGDRDPDFLAAVRDLTASACKKRNEVTPDSPDVFYQWVGSVQTKAASGKFPLNLTYTTVKLFDGRNDGLVGENSFAWGQRYAFLDMNLKQGISHADMIDLNRENIEGFDVREFYVQMVADLKQRGF